MHLTWGHVLCLLKRAESFSQSLSVTLAVMGLAVVTTAGEHLRRLQLIPCMLSAFTSYFKQIEIDVLIFFGFRNCNLSVYLKMKLILVWPHNKAQLLFGSVIRRRWRETEVGPVCLVFSFFLCLVSDPQGSAARHRARQPLSQGWDSAARGSAGATGEGIDPFKERHGQGKENKWRGMSVPPTVPG